MLPFYSTLFAKEDKLLIHGILPCILALYSIKKILGLKKKIDNMHKVTITFTILKKHITYNKNDINNILIWKWCCTNHNTRDDTPNQIYGAT